MTVRVVAVGAQRSATKIVLLQTNEMLKRNVNASGIFFSKLTKTTCSTVSVYKLQSHSVAYLSTISAKNKQFLDNSETARYSANVDPKP